MRLYLDITQSMYSNSGTPAFGLPERYLGDGTSPLFPLRVAYVPQVRALLPGAAPTGYPPDDGLPIMLDDEQEFSFASAGGDLSKLQDICRRYLAVGVEVKRRAPTSPLCFYGILPDGPDQLQTYGQGLIEARTPLAKLADWCCIDTGDSVPPAQFDAQLAWTDGVVAEFPHLKAVALIRPNKCTDDEFRRRLEAAATKENISGILIWTALDADFGAMAPSYPQIAREIAVKYPGGRPLRNPPFLDAMARVTDYLLSQARDTVSGG